MSVTRGRGKTIVFLSRQLFSPAFEIIMNGELSEGVNFMRNLEKFEEEKGETVNYQFGEVGLKVLRMKGV